MTYIWFGGLILWVGGFAVGYGVRSLRDHK
jgi:hypothetical protein